MQKRFKGRASYHPKRQKWKWRMIAIRKAKVEKSYSKIQVLSDANEAVQAIKGLEDWSINSVVLDITCESRNFGHQLAWLCFAKDANLAWW